MRRLNRAHRRLAADPEAGTSLIEMLVALVLMTICGAIFTGAVVSLFKAANQAQAVTSTSQQTNRAYQTLDRTVRYAAALSTPGTGTSGDWYIEVRNTSTGTEKCTQLRVDLTTQLLQRRTWTASSVNATLTPWVAVASGVTNGSESSTSTSRPFVVTQASNGRQQLTVNLVDYSGTGSNPVTSRSTFTLSAINGTITAPTDSICQQAGRP